MILYKWPSLIIHDFSWLVFVFFLLSGSHKLFLQFLLTGKISAQVQSHIRSRIRFNCIPSISTHKCGGMKIMTPVCTYSYSSLPQGTGLVSVQGGRENLNSPRTQDANLMKRSHLQFSHPSFYHKGERKYKQMVYLQWAGVELSTISFWQHFYMPGDRHLWMFCKWNWMDIQFFKIG